MILNKSISLNIDFDDFYLSQSELGRPSKYSNLYHVEKETNDVLEFFDLKKIKFSAFIPGHFYEKFPYLVKKIFKEKHHICSHGKKHIQYYLKNKNDRIFDLKNSKEELENITGHKIETFKAPCWSIKINLLDEIREAGYDVDFSIKPNEKKKSNNNMKFFFIR